MLCSLLMRCRGGMQAGRCLFCDWRQQVEVVCAEPSLSPPLFSQKLAMSFALRNASRAAPAVARGARSYATPASLFSVADAAGVKVASSDEGATTGAISVVVKAGSRYESAPGLAHVLKHQVFKVSDQPYSVESPSALCVGQTRAHALAGRATELQVERLACST